MLLVLCFCLVGVWRSLRSVVVARCCCSLLCFVVRWMFVSVVVCCRCRFLLLIGVIVRCRCVLLLFVVVACRWLLSVVVGVCCCSLRAVCCLVGSVD